MSGFLSIALFLLKFSLLYYDYSTVKTERKLPIFEYPPMKKTRKHSGWWFREICGRFRTLLVMACWRRRTHTLAGTPSHPHWQVIRRFPNSSHLYSNSDNTDSGPKLMPGLGEFGAFVRVTEDLLSEASTGWWCDFASHHREHHVDFAKQWLTGCRFKHVLFSIGIFLVAFVKYGDEGSIPKLVRGKMTGECKTARCFHQGIQYDKDDWLGFLHLLWLVMNWWHRYNGYRSVA